MKNKKLFAILTLVCFMFTLMPVAAFADESDLSATASVFATVDSNVDALKGETVDAQISLKNVGGNAYASDKDETVYVWAETVAGQPNDAFEVSKGAADKGNKGVYSVKVKSIKDLTIKFYRAGNYTLKASFQNPLTAKNVEDVVLFAGAADSYKTVNVEGTAPDTAYWGVNVKATGVDEFLTDGEETNKALVVKANTVKEETVTLTVYSGTEKNATSKKMPVVTTYPVSFETSSDNIEIKAESTTTNHNGQIEFKVAGVREGSYKVYVTVGDLEVAVLVQVGATSANAIEVIKAPSAPVAKDTKIADYEDVIRFQVTDVNGNIVTADQIGNCTYDNTTGYKITDNIAPYVTILEQPAKSKIKDKEIYLDKVAGEGYYTLNLTTGNFDVEGTYTVKVILDNGNSAVVTWEVKKFATPVELVLTYTQEAIELGGTALIDELVYVDEFGVTKPAAKDTDLAATGYAIANFYPTSTKEVTEKVNGKVVVVEPAHEKGEIAVKTGESYIGKTITVTGVSERYNLVATATIKVTADAAELAFADKTAAVNVNNKIGVQVVDAEGNKVAPTNVSKYEIYYVVLDKPVDAKVSVTTASDADFAATGKFVMALTSNKVGNVTVQAVAKLTTNTGVVKYYTGTQVFAVGTEGTGDVVVMSIGSTEIVKNDVVSDMGVAPIVENGRTFVPYRAGLEALGATVAYDEATQAVTAEMNGTTVVMTIGSNVYTVNGVEKTMDVAPFISESRTMVPARFAAQAFGITVIPTQNPDGTTADVLYIM